MDAKATTDAATTTTDGQDKPNVVASAGVVTDTTDTSQEDTTKKVDPKVAQALKALEDAGVTVYTERQQNAREAALRRKMEQDAKDSAAKAQADAQAQALAEQGQFKPLYEQAQVDVKERDARIARMEPVLVDRLTLDTKDWPKTILQKKPTEGGYDALLTWYETYKDVAAELASVGTQGRAANYGQYAGVGKLPTPSGSNGKEQIDPYVSRRQA